MKKIQFFSLLAGLVFGSLAFVACGDDDDNNNNDQKSVDQQSVETPTLVGTWQKEFKESGENMYFIDRVTFNFKADNAFEVLMLRDEYVKFDITQGQMGNQVIAEDDDPRPESGFTFSFIEKQKLSGTYSVEGNVLKFKVTTDSFYQREVGRWETNSNDEPTELVEGGLKFEFKDNNLVISATSDDVEPEFGPWHFDGEYTKK